MLVLYDCIFPTFAYVYVSLFTFVYYVHSTRSLSSVNGLPTNQRSWSPGAGALEASVRSMPVDPVPAEHQQLANQWLVVSVKFSYMFCRQRLVFVFA